MATEHARDLVTIACQSRTHFKVEPGSIGVARVLCRDRHCKQYGDETVIHYFDLATGAIVRTHRYRKAEREALAAR